MGGYPFNIKPGNLALTPVSVICINAYKKGHRPLDSFGNQAMAIQQFDLKGKLINNFSSISMAAKITGIGVACISETLSGKSHYAKDSIFQLKSGKDSLKEVPERAIKKRESDELHARIDSQYDMHGKKIREFANIRAAAESLGIKPEQIRRGLLGYHASVQGFLWAFGKGKRTSTEHVEERISAWKKSICRPVTQYDLAGKRIAHFESVAEAARVNGIDGMNISGALRNPNQQTANGYIWHYGHGPAVIKVPDILARKRVLQELYAQPVT